MLHILSSSLRDLTLRMEDPSEVLQALNMSRFRRTEADGAENPTPHHTVSVPESRSSRPDESRGRPKQQPIPICLRLTRFEGHFLPIDDRSALVDFVESRWTSFPANSQPLVDGPAQVVQATKLEEVHIRLAFTAGIPHPAVQASSIAAQPQNHILGGLDDDVGRLKTLLRDHSEERERKCKLKMEGLFWREIGTWEPWLYLDSDNIREEPRMIPTSEYAWLGPSGKSIAWM